MINYHRSEEIFYVAKINQILERYDESTTTFSKLLNDEEYKNAAILNIADNYIAQDKLAEAEKDLTEIITLYPRMGVAYEKLSEIAEKRGNSEQVMEYRKKAIFYNNVLEFLDLEYSKENFELLVLFGTDESTVEEKMSKLNEIYEANDTEFTIDICLTILQLHANHGNGVEEKATELLSKIGEPSIQKVNKLFQEDVSTCTITNLADVMATVKDESSWELMMAYLPYIATMPMTMIPPNLPEKMVKFDKKKGVREILLVVQPLLTKKKESDNPMAELSGFGQYVYYSPLKEIKRSKLLKTAKKLGYSEEELKLLEQKVD
jgi:tetratricopeptide (TPR) repeat protein